MDFHSLREFWNKKTKRSMPSAIMSTDIPTLIEDDNAGGKSQTESPPSSNGVIVSRSVVRRKGVRKSNSGSTRPHRGTERSRSASGNKSLAPNSNQQRVSKFASRHNLDASIASTNSPTSDDDSLGNYSLESENQTQQKRKDQKSTSNMRTQIGRNRECDDTLDSQNYRPTFRRTGSRSSEVSEQDITSPLSRSSPILRVRKKPSSVLSGDDSLTSSSFNSPPPSARSKIKKQSSTPKLEDPALDSSMRSDKTKGRSTSKASSTKHRSSAGKQIQVVDGEKVKRHSRRSRTPDDSLNERRSSSVSEDEIMRLLSSTNDPPLVRREDETQQRATRSRRESKSPRRRRDSRSPRRFRDSRSPRRETAELDGHEKRSLRKHPSDIVQRRRSNSSGALDNRVKVMRRFSMDMDGGVKAEKKEKRSRKPPARSRSNNIGVDGSRLDSFLQHDGTASRRKKAVGSSRSVLSSSKSVSLSGNRTVVSARSSKSRRRRKDVHGGKSPKSVSPDAFASIGHRRSVDDDDLILESDYDDDDDDYDDDSRSVDLDLATARDNFAQQNLNEKLQLHLTKTDELLYSVFPKHVADALRNGKKVAPENHDLVTIFFSDIVGFTDISAKLDPLKISDMLDRLYNSFDALSDYHDVFKVETIGDAYMAVTNLTKEQPDHCKRITEFAIDAIRVANQTLVDEDNPSMGFVNIRVGFHSGSVVSNVVGTRNPRYCLFGDTVNTASRMESNSEKNRIHCSETSAALLREQCPRMRIFPRGSIDVKGKGEMKTFWIHTEGSFSARDRNKGALSNFMKAVRKR